MLIDLDPTTDGQWPHVRQIALVVRDVLDELGLPAYPKTSGATGLHVLTPIRAELRFPDVGRFAKAVAVEVERRVGDQDVATTTWRVAERRGVFVDFGQNARDRTIACAYSVRPTPDARVSAPVAWDEVAEVEPGAFTVESMHLRARGRPSRRRRDLASLPRVNRRQGERRAQAPEVTAPEFKRLVRQVGPKLAKQFEGASLLVAPKGRSRTTFSGLPVRKHGYPGFLVLRGARRTPLRPLSVSIVQHVGKRVVGGNTFVFLLAARDPATAGARQRSEVIHFERSSYGLD
jgi:hypothetical protein